MQNPLIAKLDTFTDLRAEDKEAPDVMVKNPIRRKARTDLIRDGDIPEQVIIMLDGWACRYKVLADGGATDSGIHPTR